MASVVRSYSIDSLWRCRLLFVSRCCQHHRLVQEFRNLSPVLFTIALSLAIVLLLPTPFVKVGAGAIFPFWMAVVVNFIASMVGGFIAFVLGRWLFRESIQEAIQNDQRMLNIEAALGEDAMRISVLVLSPILPDEWLNYIMSATPYRRVFLLSNLSSLIYCLIMRSCAWLYCA